MTRFDVISYSYWNKICIKQAYCPWYYYNRNDIITAVKWFRTTDGETSEHINMHATQQKKWT